MSLHMNVDKWVPSLKPFWDRGMNSWKKSELIQEASNATGLSTEDVKHWMSNYRKRIQRQEKRERTSSESRTSKAQKRKWSGYDVYKQECLAAGKKSGSDLSKSWKDLPSESKQLYNKKAAASAAAGARQHETSSSDGEILKALNIIRKQINVLSSAQCKGSVFMCIPPGRSTIECVGDAEAQRLIQQSGEFRKIYVQTFTDGAEVVDNPLPSNNKLVTVKDCTHNGFTCKYEEATGNNCMCPYRKFTEQVYNAIANGNTEGLTPEHLVRQIEAALAPDSCEQFMSVGSLDSSKRGVAMPTTPTTVVSDMESQQSTHVTHHLSPAAAQQHMSQQPQQHVAQIQSQQQLQAPTTPQPQVHTPHQSQQHPQPHTPQQQQQVQLQPSQHAGAAPVAQHITIVHQAPPVALTPQPQTVTATHIAPLPQQSQTITHAAATHIEHAHTAQLAAHTPTQLTQAQAAAHLPQLHLLQSIPHSTDGVVTIGLVQQT